MTTAHQEAAQRVPLAGAALALTLLSISPACADVVTGGIEVGTGHLNGAFRPVMESRDDAIATFNTLSDTNVEIIAKLLTGIVGSLSTRSIFIDSTTKRTSSTTAGDSPTFALTDEMPLTRDLHDFALLSVLDASTDELLLDGLFSPHGANSKLIFREDGYDIFAYPFPLGATFTIGSAFQNAEDEVMNAGLMRDEVELQWPMVLDPSRLPAFGLLLVAASLAWRRRL